MMTGLPKEHSILVGIVYVHKGYDIKKNFTSLGKKEHVPYLVPLQVLGFHKKTNLNGHIFFPSIPLSIPLYFRKTP